MSLIGPTKWAKIGTWIDWGNKTNDNTLNIGQSLNWVIQLMLKMLMKASLLISKKTFYKWIGDQWSLMMTLRTAILMGRWVWKNVMISVRTTRNRGNNWMIISFLKKGLKTNTAKVLVSYSDMTSFIQTNLALESQRDEEESFIKTWIEQTDRWKQISIVKV